MDMKLPDSGSWLDDLFGDVTSAHLGDAFVMQGVNEADLNAAIEAMVRGDIEFVILEDSVHGDGFLQAAGQGDGPYQLNYKAANDETLYEVTGGVSVDRVKSALGSYRNGDGRWHAAHHWSPL